MRWYAVDVAILGATLVFVLVRGYVRELRREHERRRRLHRRGVLIGMGGLLGAIALLPAVPYAMGIVGDVEQSETRAIPAENRGVYAVTSTGATQLFTWSIDVPVFPDDAACLEAGTVEAFGVVAKTFDPPSEYRLRRVGQAHSVPWASTARDGGVFLLTPPQLDPGDYELVVPTGSMYGGVTRHFLTLVDGSPGRGVGCSG